MVSARRNELLAELFQRSHRIEKWGRGIKMIQSRATSSSERIICREICFWLEGLCDAELGVLTEGTLQVQPNIRSHNILNNLTRSASVPLLAQRIRPRL